jgi:nucleotide-binding universal stress UspA family protein
VPYKTILVHVDISRRAAERVDIACRLARSSDAHLIGLHAMSTLTIPSYALVEGGAQIREYHDRMVQEAAARAEETFKQRAQAAGLERTEWRTSPGDAATVVPVHARYADVLIIGQAAENDPGGVEPDFVDRVILTSGRPVIVIPYAGEFASVGQRVLVAWNASREATRALTDAIPLLRDATEVHVIAFNPRGAPHGALPGADIGLYLARHGINVNVSQQTAEDVDVGNQLLSRAADLDIDLVVMGGYGHSRLQEMVMGGATRTVLGSMTVPVLFSH